MEFEESANAVLQRLPEVDQGYLDTAFHNYYVDYGAPPDTLADICAATESSHPEAVIDLLEDVRKVLISAAQLDKVEAFWDIAIELGRSERYFLGLIYMGVSQATASGRIADKIVGLLSCQMYLSLMLVPKTGVNLLFPSLLQSCLSMLSLPAATSGHSVTSSLVSPEKRRGRSFSADSRSVTVDDEVYPIETLQDYVEHITEALDCLRLFLTTVSLEEHDDVVSALCQYMAALTENEMLGPQAYEVLSSLCDRHGLHGEIPELLKVISFRLNGNLLMLRAAIKDQVPRAMVKARDSSIRFLLGMRERVGSDEYLIITIQQLAMRSLEKADIRFRTAQGVLHLVLQLEEESLTRTLHWFHKMIRSKLPRHRLFSLELFGQICSLQNTPPVSDADKRKDTQALRRHLSNIALAALERVMDELATVKAKAFAFFAQLTNTPHWMDNLVTNECSHEDVIGALLGILNECVKDSKVHVRKSALNVLNGILCGDTEFDKGPYVDVIVRCCRDQTILVRKHALECLLKVYRRHPCYYKEFVSGVFPLTMDNEASVQEKALACVLDVVFDSILPGHNANSAWVVLRHLGTYERYLPSICEQLCKQDGKVQLERQHVRALVKALDTPNSSLAWKLLSYLCNHTNVDLDGYSVMEDQLDDDAECCRLSVLLTQSNRKRGSGHYLESLLTILNDPATSFMRLAHVCSILLHLDKAQLVQWAEATIPQCLTIMEGATKANTQKVVSEDDLMAAMFKTGECVLVLPRAADLHLCTLLRAIVQDTKQPLAVRRMALRVLGQISLVSVDLAKRLVALIGDTVDNAEDLSLRVIGIRTVADLSCRYATLSDQLLPVVYCLLKDPETEVRRAAIINLLQLLKEEYIKLRNNFLYHMLECMLDEDEMLRDLSEFGLDQFVLKKNPNLFLHNFIDCVFHLNAYRGHSLYNQVLQTPREIQTFSLVGQPGKRQVIYRFMVRRLTDEHKFLLTLNICNNVLKAIVDNETAVDRECPAIVIDLLEVLCMDELRLRVNSRGDEDDGGGGPVGEENGSTSVTATSNVRHTRKKEQFILNAIKLKTMIESILPPLTMLKSRSSCEDNDELMTALMSYLNVLNHEYKNELKSLLVGNSASEFYNDLKKFEATRSRLDDSIASSATENPQQESKMKLIMKVLQSARKQQRAILNRDQAKTPPEQTEPAAKLPDHTSDTADARESAKPGDDATEGADEPAESAANGQVQQQAADDLTEDIVMTDAPAERRGRDAPVAERKGDIMELSGFELLTEEELELERLRPERGENGIPADEGLDNQQSGSEGVFNGDVVGSVGSPPPTEDVERMPPQKTAGDALAQNGVEEASVNGYEHGRNKQRKRPFVENGDTADGQRAGKMAKMSGEANSSCDIGKTPKLPRSPSAVSELSRTSPRRLCEDFNEPATDNDAVIVDGLPASDDTSDCQTSSRSPGSEAGICSSDRRWNKNMNRAQSGVRSELVHSRSVSSGSAGSQSTDAVSAQVCPQGLGSMESRSSSAISSSASTQLSRRVQRNAAATLSLEARWRHEYNLKPFEVVMVRNPVVEICAKEMRRTGQSTFRMVTKVPDRASPIQLSRQEELAQNNPPLAATSPHSQRSRCARKRSSSKGAIAAARRGTCAATAFSTSVCPTTLPQTDGSVGTSPESSKMARPGPGGRQSHSCEPPSNECTIDASEVSDQPLPGDLQQTRSHSANSFDFRHHQRNSLDLSRSSTEPSISSASPLFRLLPQIILRPVRLAETTPDSLRTDKPQNLKEQPPQGADLAAENSSSPASAQTATSRRHRSSRSSSSHSTAIRIRLLSASNEPSASGPTSTVSATLSLAGARRTGPFTMKAIAAAGRRSRSRRRLTTEFSIVATLAVEKSEQRPPLSSACVTRSRSASAAPARTHRRRSVGSAGTSTISSSTSSAPSPQQQHSALVKPTPDEAAVSALQADWISRYKLKRCEVLLVRSHEASLDVVSKVDRQDEVGPSFSTHRSEERRMPADGDIDTTELSNNDTNKRRR
ncbi:condensin-2 complex subunit D3-like [Tropilaelaps mercedesae]|uniref:Condensin-2 complex subunit D3-like n=1 Tax=Tropilaelaps mercedesae TaxID=418985 RepID=A0A1V9XQQ1_9ACAR|nr:condensin-2 complex subunit D3-like [Tropilaelaps mercedesae]